MQLVYRKAELTEIDTTFLILKEAAHWIKQRDLNYWQEWINPDESLREWIQEGFDNNEFYFVERDRVVVGMFRLQYEDELFWPNKNDKAGYIHSFATRRKYEGMGIGLKILEYIIKKLQSENVEYLRLNCTSKVTGINNYYLKAGFNYVGQKELFGDIWNLYEMKLKAG